MMNQVKSLTIWDGNEESPRIEIWTEPRKIIANFISPGSTVISKMILETGQAPRLEYRLRDDKEISTISINNQAELHIDNKSDCIGFAMRVDRDPVWKEDEIKRIEEIYLNK